jgi:hypothetical protein
MAPITTRAGYPESSNTPLRHYGHAAAWTGTPEAGAASLVPEDVAGEPPGAGPAALTRVQGGTLPDGDRRNAGGYDVESLI